MNKQGFYQEVIKRTYGKETQKDPQGVIKGTR